MSASITGVVAPIVTPFDDEGELRLEAVSESVEFTLECGCHGIVAAGTGVQETSSLTPTERADLMSATIDAVDGRVPVLAGVSYPAQPVVDDLIDRAESEDADGLLAMPPWGVQPDTEAIVRYYERIGARTNLPILLYNNPRVALDVPKETMARVARQVDEVRYVKESSRNWNKLSWLFDRVHHAGHADVFATMDVLQPTLQAVGTGAIVPAPLSVPCMRIYEAMKAGDPDRAAEVQRTFDVFPPDSVESGLTPVCKAATEIGGAAVGPPRTPYSHVTEDERTAVEAWMDEHDVPRMG